MKECGHGVATPTYRLGRASGCERRYVDRSDEGPTDSRDSELLTIRIESDLLRKVRTKASDLGMDVSAYVRWCIITGASLSDLNAFIRSKMSRGP